MAHRGSPGPLVPGGTESFLHLLRAPPASSVLEITWPEVSPLKACGQRLLRIEWVKDYFLAPEGHGILL